MMSDPNPAEEVKDETPKTTITNVESATLTAEVNGAQNVETATIANNSSPSPKSETPALNVDTFSDDNQNVSDSTASVSQKTGNDSSVVQDEIGSKCTNSDIAEGSVDTKISESIDSKQLDVSFPLSKVDQDTSNDQVMIEATSLNEVVVQKTPESSLESVEKKMCKNGNNAESEEVEKVCLTDEINVDSEVKLASDCGKQPFEPVDSSRLPESELNKDPSFKVDQPLNPFNENYEKSTEKDESGATKLVPKKVEKLIDSVDDSVKEQLSEDVKNSSSFEVSEKNDKTGTSKAPEQSEKVVCQKNVAPVLDISKTEMELVCKVSDVSKDSDTKQITPIPEKKTDRKEISDAKQTTSEVNQIAPKVEQTTPKVEQTTPKVEQTTPKVEQTARKVEQTAPEVEQTAPEVEQTASEVELTAPEAEKIVLKVEQTAPQTEQMAPKAEQTVPEAEQIAPDAKQTTSGPKQTVSEAKQQTTSEAETLSNPKETACGEKRTTSETERIFEAKQTCEVKQIVSEAKQTSNTKQASRVKQTSDAKQKLDPKESPSDAEQTVAEVKEKISDVEQSIHQEEETASEVKQTTSEAKHTSDGKGIKVVADCSELDSEEAKNDDNKLVSEVHEGKTVISNDTQEVQERSCIKKTDPGREKLTDSSLEKAVEATLQLKVTDSSKDFVKLRTSDSPNQEPKSKNSLIDQVDLDRSASNSCETANDKSVKMSVDSTLEASESNSSFVDKPLIGETVPSFEKMSVNESNDLPEDKKSVLVGAESKMEDVVSVLSSDGSTLPVKENSETSNSIDKIVNDLPSSIEDSLETEQKKETETQNSIDQAVVEPNLTGEKLESTSAVVKSVESSAVTDEAKLTKKEPEKTLKDVKLEGKKSPGITVCSVSQPVASKLESEKLSSGEVNSLSKKDSKKTDLESAIEAVKEEAENIKSIKESINKSSVSKESKDLEEIDKQIPSTKKEEPSVINDEALHHTEKQEPTTDAPNFDVVDKINGTAVPAVVIIHEGSDKLSEISSEALSAAEVSCNAKNSAVETEKEISEAGNEVPGTENKVPSAPNKPKTTKVMPSLREIRKVPIKSVSKEVKPVTVTAAVVGEKSSVAASTSFAAVSVSIVKKPKLSDTISDSVETASMVKPSAETKVGEVSEGPNEKVKAQEDPGKSDSGAASDQKAGKTQPTLNDSKQIAIKKVENVKPAPIASSNGSKSIVKPRKSTENDPLLNITSECRVELEITKIPANCQLKTEPGGKPIFVLKKDSASFSTQENADKKQKSLLKNFVSNSGQTPKMTTPTRPLNRVSGITKMSSDDSAVVNRPVGPKRPGRKRAITIDMTRPSGLQPPAVKVVKMDPNMKSRIPQMQRTVPKAGPSPKTTSALEMLLMNRGVTHNSSISDASVANFCQVEQLVTEPDMYSTPINQLKKLSKGPADSILKQIAFGSQQFGAITISPVKPSSSSQVRLTQVKPTPLPLVKSTPSPLMKSTPASQIKSTPSPQVVRSIPSGISLKASPRPAPVVRSSSVDNVIEGVVAGQGVISEKCLLELNSAGEPKKKRGRPRKIIPGASPQLQQGETLQCAPDLFFVPHEEQPTMRSLAPKPVSVPVSMSDASQASSPVSEMPVSTPTESGVETPEVEEGKESDEPKKTASGRVIRTCTMKEPKKKANATPNSGSKAPRSGKKKKDDEPAEPDPEEEARKQKALEDEAKRKAELKEKRQQERREKMELRTKALAEKKAKLKRRAEERKRQYYEKKQRLQEEKAEMERQRALAPPENFSEETQMGDENESAGELIRNKKGRMEVIDPESSKEFKVHQVAEYQWPLQGGEFFMLQEQISQYLGVKSFKRKYPDITRRTIEAEERTFLCDSGLVSETMCDLGLTALRSADVLDIMFADFHDKYEEFRQHLRDMQAKEFSLKQLALAGKPSGDHLDSIGRAVQSAARWNSALNKSRQESRRCCLDLQTFVIQYPRSRLPKVTQDIPKIGNYPISLIPGQFTDYYKPYSAADLRYLPINTVLYGPIKPYNVIVRESQNDYLSESEDSSSSDGSSSSSSDGSDSEDSGDEVAMDIDVPGQEGAICKICNGNKNKNKRNKPEVLIHCAQCSGSCHPSCLDLSLEMVPHIQRYEWQCTDCKKCLKCKEVSDEDKMLFCDLCDRGYHFYCVGLRKVPVGRWHCQECAVCASCSCHEPGPDETSLWHHEFKRGGKGGKNTYLRSFCENCAKDQTPAEGNILKKES